MRYCSTRNRMAWVDASQAILQGIAPDGGLYVPEVFPVLTGKQMLTLQAQDYAARTAFVLQQFLNDFSDDEIQTVVEQGYRSGHFLSSKIAELREVKCHLHVLELWHGPTCAFKDMALQLLPHLLTLSYQKQGGTGEVAVLTATSGDTGKAALEGFRDVGDTSVIVFYPDDGVSEMQKMQMVTQPGENLHVCAVKGNFDDAQTGVKQIFADQRVQETLLDKGVILSSANSINWGRLVVQIAYYLSAYCDLIKWRKIRLGDEINVVVPTGNFGNILAAYYAKQMGIPIAELICASNANEVLTEFLQTGVYNRNRHFFRTLSPSMDILVSSNLERLLFHLLERDDQRVKLLYGKLQKHGTFRVPQELFEGLFYAGSCDDETTRRVIRETFLQNGYLCDPHTAVAMGVYQEYQEKTQDHTPTVVVSTASPFKFPQSVLQALGQAVPRDIFAQADALAQYSGWKIPQPIAQLKDHPVRFNTVIPTEQMPDYVMHTLGKERKP